MQDRYVSLDPSYAQGPQTRSERSAIWRQRCQEAKGGPMARQVGLLSMITGGYLTYYQLQKGGFQMFPMASHKLRQYTILFGVAFLSYHFASSFVSEMTGDQEQFRYLMKYRNQIMAGKQPFEKPLSNFSKEKNQEEKQ